MGRQGNEPAPPNLLSRWCSGGELGLRVARFPILGLLLLASVLTTPTRAWCQLGDSCNSPILLPSCNETIPLDTSLATPPAGTPDPELPPSGPACQALGDPTLTHNTVWFEFIATEDSIWISTCGATSSDTILALYGGTCGNLLEEACDEDSCAGPQSPATICATGLVTGEVYLILVAHPGGNPQSIPGPMQLELVCPCPNLPMGPPNDECANALSLSLGVPFNFDSTGALQDGTPGGCATGLADVWWTFVAPVTGTYKIGTCGAPGFDTTLHVYGNSFCPPQPGDEIACNNNACGIGSQVLVDMIGGDLYRVRVGGWLGATGTAELLVTQSQRRPINFTCTQGATSEDYELNWSPPPGPAPLSYDIYSNENGPFVLLGSVNHPTTSWIGSVVPGFVGDVEFRVEAVGASAVSQPASCTIFLGQVSNDDCGGAITVGLGTPAITGNLTNATASSVAVSCGASQGNADLWYRYTATCTGTTIISTCGTHDIGGIDAGVDTVLSVYEACGGVELSCNDDAIAGQCSSDLGLPRDSRVSLPLLAGEEVLVRVSHFASSPIQSGEFVLNVDCTALEAPPTDVICSYDNLTDTATVQWSPSSSGTATSYEILSDQSGSLQLEGTVSHPLGTFSFGLNPGVLGAVNICVRTLGSAGPSALVCCQIGVGGPPNDQCANALSIFDGVTPFDTTLASTDGTDLEPFCDPGPAGTGQIFNDVWYLYDAIATGLVRVSTCNDANFDTRLAVYDQTSCPDDPQLALACDDDATGQGGTGATCNGFTSELTFPAQAGTTYLIRVGGFGANSVGTGNLTIAPFCESFFQLDCEFDCLTESVQLDWTNANGGSYPGGLEVFANGVLVFSDPTGQALSFTDSSPPPGHVVYEIVGMCANGSTTSSDCSIDVTFPAENLILALEGLGPSGNVGNIDSAVALQEALLLLGRTVTIFGAADFDQSPCLADLLSAADNLWVLTGTFPDDYRISAAEGLLLASTASLGRNIYFEGADHWGFQHVVSPFDDVDGIDPTATLDGGDFVDFLAPSDASQVGLLLSSLPGAANGIFYEQDQTGSDFTDRLALAPGDPGVLSAEVIWSNFDNTGMEPPTVVGVVTEVVGSSSFVISSSVEFGGIGGMPMSGPPQARVELAAAYLSLFGALAPPPFFTRGDVNLDGTVNIADAIAMLAFLFNSTGGDLPCADAGDGNDDGTLNIADAIVILGSLFGVPSVPLPAPTAPNCGSDPTADALSCLQLSC